MQIVSNRDTLHETSNPFLCVCVCVRVRLRVRVCVRVCSWIIVHYLINQ